MASLLLLAILGNIGFVRLFVFLALFVLFTFNHGPTFFSTCLWATPQNCFLFYVFVSEKKKDKRKLLLGTLKLLKIKTTNSKLKLFFLISAVSS